jgi:hypothetical protein
MAKKPTVETTTVEKCCAGGCKATSARFSFCEEHFEHFKFGLIKKDGTKVPDFEKKMSQYQDHQVKTVRKVA